MKEKKETKMLSDTLEQLREKNIYMTARMKKLKKIMFCIVTM